VILNVPPGRHKILASFIGYRRYEVNDLRVSVDFTTPLDIDLVEGSVELDAVVIQAERSPLIRQDLTNPVASISSEAIEALPVTDISEVIGLQAGITVDDDGTIHIRGGMGNEIAYTLNGMNINNPYGNTRAVGVATNAVREVSVSSGTFSAEYGSALSGVVNYVTRDGGPRWAGSAKYFTGDHVSRHNDVFFNIDKFDLANVNRTEVTIGGPVAGEDLTFFAPACTTGTAAISTASRSTSRPIPICRGKDSPLRIRGAERHPPPTTSARCGTTRPTGSASQAATGRSLPSTGAVPTTFRET